MALSGFGAWSLAALTIIFAAGMFTYFLAIRRESQAQAPLYVTYATFGAALSIAATFLGVLLTIFGFG